METYNNIMKVLSKANEKQNLICDNFGLIKVGAVSPKLKVADCDYNTEEINRNNYRDFLKNTSVNFAYDKINQCLSLMMKISDNENMKLNFVKVLKEVIPDLKELNDNDVFNKFKKRLISAFSRIEHLTLKAIAEPFFT